MDSDKMDRMKYMNDLFKNGTEEAVSNVLNEDKAPKAEIKFTQADKKELTAPEQPEEPCPCSAAEAWRQQLNDSLEKLVSGIQDPQVLHCIREFVDMVFERLGKIKILTVGAVGEALQDLAKKSDELVDGTTADKLLVSDYTCRILRAVFDKSSTLTEARKPVKEAAGDTVDILKKGVAIPAADARLGSLLADFLHDKLSEALPAGDANAYVPKDLAEAMANEFAATLEQFDGLALPNGTTYRKAVDLKKPVAEGVITDLPVVDKILQTLGLDVTELPDKVKAEVGSLLGSLKDKLLGVLGASKGDKAKQDKFAQLKAAQQARLAAEKRPAPVTRPKTPTVAEVIEGIFDPGMESLWARTGDASEYEEYGTDLDALAEGLTMVGVELPLTWRQSGFETAKYPGDNYVSLYWGDLEAEYVRDLSAEEKTKLEKLIDVKNNPATRKAASVVPVAPEASAEAPADESILTEAAKDAQKLVAGWFAGKDKGQTRKVINPNAGELIGIPRMSIQDDTLYSYKTPMAMIDRDNKVVFMNPKKYSLTTTRQQNYIRMAAEGAGFRVIDDPEIATASATEPAAAPESLVPPPGTVA